MPALLADMPHLEESGADGIGLFRTELQFMLSELPAPHRQTQPYRAVLDEANGKPVSSVRSILAATRCFRIFASRRRIRRSAGGHPYGARSSGPVSCSGAGPAARRQWRLHIMVPMLITASEMDELRGLVDKELAHARRHGYPLPSTLNVGAMIELPSLLFELDPLLPKVDFVSVGSNDLLQFLLRPIAPMRRSRIAMSRCRSLRCGL